MEEIAKRKDIFISDTDKFGGAVIMNTIFISESNNQLSDQDSNLLRKDRTLHHKEIERFIKKTVSKTMTEELKCANFKR